jgi:hypothetical protein
MTTRRRVAGLDRLAQMVHVVRAQRVMLDSDLGRLYGVPTKVLVQAVTRNTERFPADFMFRLSETEAARLRSQLVTSNTRGGRRYLPYAFTEQGVAMLSSVLRSLRAIQVNIEIMRIFVRLRRLPTTQAAVVQRLDRLERKLGRHDHEIAAVFDAMRQLMASPPSARKWIGF